jgi:uncharacterized protein (TIGR03437 family)
MLLIVTGVLSAESGIWSTTGDMSRTRRDHAAALLADGRVLIVCGAARSAEIYDPATGTFAPTADTIEDHGSNCTATRLPDGRVLVIGGTGARETAEIYDPVTSAFSLTGAPTNGHDAHTATLLQDGRVLVAAGFHWPGANRETSAVAELYDPATGQFARTGDLNVARAGHVAALLPNGQMLIAGGLQTTGPGTAISLRSAELYDPVTGTFTLTADMTRQRSSMWHAQAPLLANGKVLLAGDNVTTAAELFDPETGTFAATGDMAARRAAGTATLLGTQRVLVAGGYTASGPVTTNSAELYDPATESFRAAASMAVARQQHSATLLADGRVLVVGGTNPTDGNLSSAELFLPPPGAFHGASFLPGPAFAPDSWVSLFGIELAAAAVAAESVPLPTALGGIGVTLTDSGGIPHNAQLLYVGPNQINFLAPSNVAAGPAVVTVVRDGGPDYETTIEIAPVAPGLFAANANGTGVAAGFAIRVRGDGSQVAEPLFVFDSGQGLFVTSPISHGPETESLYLMLFGTGLRGHAGLETVELTVGGEPVPVQYAGDQLQFAGLDQLNAGPLPRTLSGVLDAVLTVDGATANTLTLELF